MKVKLGDYIEQIRGVSYQPTDLMETLSENSIALLRANNIQEDGLNFEDIVYVSRDRVSKNQIIRSGDILVCTSSGSKNLVGKAAQSKENIGMTFGAFCKVVRTDKIYPRFLGHFFCSPLYRKEISYLSTGANINNIRNEHIDGLEIVLPSIEEQKKIAEILDKASNLISLRKKQTEKMDLLIKARFIEMFGDPESNPKKWPVKKIADVIEESPQNGLYKPASDYTNDGSGIPILRIDAFYDGKVTNFRYLKRLNCTEKELELYQLHEGDIVINRVNSIEYLGKCALIKGLLENTVFESNMMRFKVKDNILNPFFVTKLLCTKHLYNQIISHAKKAVNQASINQKDVQDFEIYVPPKDLQDAFAEFVEYIEAQELELKNGLEKLELTYKALMQQYFN
ncbi:MAG: restriction endonuclease subunit S [Clostridiaceae bacterium]|jgi:type I restriction enzyme S subunit|nr:restriction endonuclease subunit S [Clostridiaceae bacterium]